MSTSLTKHKINEKISVFYFKNTVQPCNREPIRWQTTNLNGKLFIAKRDWHSTGTSLVLWVAGRGEWESWGLVRLAIMYCEPALLCYVPSEPHLTSIMSKVPKTVPATRMVGRWDFFQEKVAIHS